MSAAVPHDSSATPATAPATAAGAASAAEPATAESTAYSATGKIYRRLLEDCRPYCLPGLWQAFPANRRLRRPPADPVAVCAALAREFPAEELLASAVVVAAADGTLQPNPALADPAGMLGPLVDSEGRDPFALLTSQGLLGRPMLPLLATVRDYRLRGVIDQRQYLAVAFSPADLAVEVLRQSKLSLSAAGLVTRRLGAGWAQRPASRDRVGQRLAAAPHGDQLPHPVTMPRDLRFAWEELPQQILDVQAQKVRELSELQRDLLGVLTQRGPASLQEIATALRSPVRRRTLQDNLKVLQDHGLVIVDGRGRGARWIHTSPEGEL
jgi:hypothetical protein